MIHIWGITDKGVVRAENQDSYCFKLAQDDVATAIVCDGMGGAQAGNIASALAVKSASKYLEKLSLDELWRIKAFTVNPAGRSTAVVWVQLW